MYEIYKTEGKRQKTYLVADFNHWRLKPYEHNSIEAFIKYAMQYFHVKSHGLLLTTVWVVNDDMYFSNPQIRGAKERSAICLMNKQIEKRLGICRR